MAIYFLEIIIIVLLWPLSKLKIKVNNKEKADGTVLYLFVVFFLLTFVMAFRAPTIGTDTGTYYRMFIDISNSDSLLEAIEVSRITAPVYVTYAYILGKIVKIPQIITIINSVVVGIGMYKFIKKSSSNYLVSSLLYVCMPLYFESMNGTRQFMSIVFALNAFLYLVENKKNIRGWILLLLSFGIHNIGVVFGISIATIFISEKVKDEKILFLKSVFYSLLMVISLEFFITLIIKIFPYYAIYINGYNPTQFYDESGGGRVVLLYLALGVTILLVTYLRWDKDLKNKYIIFLIPSVVGCVILGIFYFKNVLINRLLWYFLPFFVVFIPNGYRLFKPKSRIIITGITIFVMAMYGYLHLIEDKSGIVPYITIFSLY